MSAVGALAGGILVLVFLVLYLVVYLEVYLEKKRVTTRTERVLTSQEPDPHIRSRNVAFKQTD